MQYTLLDMTQNILDAMSSDEVNSIGDTIESRQVSRIIKNKYFDLITRLNLPEHNQFIQLNPSLSSNIPVVMYVPDNVAEVQWVKYFNTNVNADGATNSQHDLNLDLTASISTANTAPGYQFVKVLPIEEFVDMVINFNPSQSNVGTYTFSDVIDIDREDMSFQNNYTLYYYNDRQPSYCTVLSNYQVLFDAYDNTQDSTLQASKIMAFGRVIPSWQMTDSFIPDLDDEQFQLLLNEAKALAFFELEQKVHPKAEQEIKRGWSTVQKHKSKSNKPTYFGELPDFGRRGGGFTSPISLFKARGWDIHV